MIEPAREADHAPRAWGGEALSDVEELRVSDLAGPGGILAAWFIANPNGPTAFALGYLEEEAGHTLFYRWMHFTDGSVWRIGSLESDVGILDGDYGHVVFNSLLRFHNFSAATGLGGRPLLGEFPSFVATNGNPQVAHALQSYLTLSAARQDWAQEFRLRRAYGVDFYSRAGAQYRLALDRLKGDPEADQARVADLYRLYSGRPGFSDVIPRDLKPVSPNLAAAQAWWSFAAAPDVVRSGLSQIAQMWAGATSQATSVLLDDLRRSGRYTSLRDVVAFFDQFQLPLWPEDLDDRRVCEALGIPTDHLSAQST